MDWKYLHRVNNTCWRLDHRLTPEVTAMFCAMASRLPAGGIEARYRQVVEAIAKSLVEDAGYPPPHMSDPEYLGIAEVMLTQYPIHPVVQEFFDKFVGQYGHGSIKELTSQPAIFIEGISPYTAYLSFDSPLVAGQESSTRAVRHKDWPMCREAYITKSILYSDVEITHHSTFPEDSVVVEQEIKYVSRGPQPPKKQLDVLMDVVKPHPELDALHKAWLEVFEAEVEAWKVELRDECGRCFGKLVDLDNMIPGVTYVEEKAFGYPDLPPCPQCVGSEGKPTGKKYPFIKDPQAFRPALDRARWAIPGTIATACSHTASIRTMSRVIQDGLAVSNNNQVWLDVAEAYDEALPGMKGMGLKEALVGEGHVVPLHLQSNPAAEAPEVRVDVIVDEEALQSLLFKDLEPRSGIKEYLDPIWNQVIQVRFKVQCSWAVARDWHRHRTFYPWNLSLVMWPNGLDIHTAYHPLSDDLSVADLLEKTEEVFFEFKNQGDDLRAMLCLPLGALVQMEGSAGLRDALYTLELRAYAHGANFEYEAQAHEALRQLRDKLPASVAALLWKEDELDRAT
jgi:hypothetical protein